MNLQHALTHHRAGRLAEAQAIYQQILAEQPNHADALHLLGLIAVAEGQRERAVELLRQAVALAPGVAGFHFDLAEALAEAGQVEPAIASYRQSLALEPNRSDTHGGLGFTFARWQRWEESAAAFRQAVALRPDWAEAQNGLGYALAQAGREDEARGWFQRAAELKPDLAEVHNNLGHVEWLHGHWEEALACYRRAIACCPDHADAHMNAGHILLLLGQWEEGWRECEWRLRSPSYPAFQRGFTAPQWDGKPTPGATIFIHADQGFGDVLHFVRYVPLVREHAQAARVIFECQSPLVRLLAQSGEWNAELVARGEFPLPPFDFHVPLLSLPLALGKYEPMPMSAPYLCAEKSAVFDEMPQTTLRVGLAWAGSPEHKDDRRRSIAFEKLGLLLRVPGVTFYSLQIGWQGNVEPVVDLTPRITDFADTAALIEGLDLVIAVDSAVAHLAGALGRRVWMLLAFVPDWRWGTTAETTPWYPSMRLFRQRTRGDWDEVIARVAVELKAMAA